MRSVRKRPDFSRIQTTESVGRLLAVPIADINQLLSRLSRNYRQRRLRKPSGALRVLNIPSEKLRLLQTKVYEHILRSVPLLPCVKGGVPGESPQTHAQLHVGQPIVVTMDIEDFFPTVDPTRVRRVFQRLGFGNDAANLLTKITTFQGQLPQGAPSSPALANLALERLDRRIVLLQLEHGFRYSRFVDDIAISGPVRLLKLKRLVERIVTDEGFRLRADKTKVMRAGQRQTITKLTVNEKVNVPSDRVSKIKREVSRALKSGITPAAETTGRVYWLRSINADVGAPLADKLRERHTR